MDVDAVWPAASAFKADGALECRIYGRNLIDVRREEIVGIQVRRSSLRFVGAFEGVKTGRTDRFVYPFLIDEDCWLSNLRGTVSSPG
jgi:hypothetical protein